MSGARSRPLAGTGDAGVERAGPDQPAPVGVHLIGTGAVGKQLLWRLASSRAHRLIGVSDSQVTLRNRHGLDALAILSVLEQGGRLSELDQVVPMPGEVAVDYVRADVVIDAAPADGRWRYHGVARVEAALRRGAHVVVLAAGPVGARAVDWFRTGRSKRLWCNVPMDGVWTRLRQERKRLRGASRILAIGDPRSSAWLDAMARCELAPPADVGAPGLALAHRLSVAVEAVRGVSLDPLSIELPTLHSCDVEQLRDRFLRGRVTRLVGRWDPEHGARVGFEALSGSDAGALDVVMDTASGTALVFEGVEDEDGVAEGAVPVDEHGRVVLVGRSAHDDARQAGAVAWGDLVACTARLVAARGRDT